MTLDEALRAAVREEVQAAVREALDGLERPERDTEPASWRSRLWTVAPETRLSLSDVSEALDVSERTVRRYMDGSGDRPALPHRKGPTGLTVTAGHLRTWIQDVEEGERFRERGRG